MTSRFWRLLARRSLFVTAITFTARFISAQEEPAEKETVFNDEFDDALSQRIEKSVGHYEIRFGDDGAALKPVTVLRWRNETRRQEGIAIMALWIDGGRPVAQASVYPWDGNITHEFDSLTEQIGVRAYDGKAAVWTPQTAGIEFQDVADAPAPAATPIARLRQMKTIAESFRGIMTGWKTDMSDREVLRLLPRELYRFNAEQLEAARSSILDGGVFAYVQGTDPEITLILQANRSENRARWQYGFARATSGGVEVTRNDEVIWSAPPDYSARDPLRPHDALIEPLN